MRLIVSYISGLRLASKLQAYMCINRSPQIDKLKVTILNAQHYSEHM